MQHLVFGYFCLKVNADLKKLLVASIGDDLHHKVDALVRSSAVFSLFHHYIAVYSSFSCLFLTVHWIKWSI